MIQWQRNALGRWEPFQHNNMNIINNNNPINNNIVNNNNNNNNLAQMRLRNRNRALPYDFPFHFQVPNNHLNNNNNNLFTRFSRFPKEISTDVYNSFQIDPTTKNGVKLMKNLNIMEMSNLAQGLFVRDLCLALMMKNIGYFHHCLARKIAKKSIDIMSKQAQIRHVLDFVSFFVFFNLIIIIFFFFQKYSTVGFDEKVWQVYFRA